MGWNNYSFMLWFSRGKSKKRYAYMDVISTPFETEIKSIKHKSPKFLKPYRRFVDLFADEGTVVLDPFLGSGTTAVACKQLNRKYIGIEINPDYCRIARERLMGIPDSLFKNH